MSATTPPLPSPPCWRQQRPRGALLLGKWFGVRVKPGRGAHGDLLAGNRTWAFLVGTSVTGCGNRQEGSSVAGDGSRPSCWPPGLKSLRGSVCAGSCRVSAADGLASPVAGHGQGGEDGHDAGGP